MKELGIVNKIKGEFAVVRIGRNSACGSCGKCGMTEKQKHVDFYTINSVNAQVGDQVEVDINEDANITKLAMYAYLLPLLISVALFFVGVWIGLPDWGNILMFLGGFAISIAILATIDKKKRHSWTANPVIIRIIKEEGEENE